MIQSSGQCFLKRISLNESDLYRQSNQIQKRNVFDQEKHVFILLFVVSYSKTNYKIPNK